MGYVPQDIFKKSREGWKFSSTRRFDIYELAWLRGGKIHELGEIHSCRIFPEEGDVWRVRSFYFSKTRELVYFRFKRGEFIRIRKEDYEGDNVSRDIQGEDIDTPGF